MLVSDLVYDDEVDINCDYIIYNVKHAAEVVNTSRQGFRKLPCKILDMRVVSINTIAGILMIKADENEV